MSEEGPVEGPAIKITSEMVSKAISKMKSGEAAGPSGIIIEMINAAGDRIINCLTSLFNQIIYDVGVPNDWYLLIFSKEKEMLYLVETKEVLNCRNK